MYSGGIEGVMVGYFDKGELISGAFREHAPFVCWGKPLFPVFALTFAFG